MITITVYNPEGEIKFKEYHNYTNFRGNRILTEDEMLEKTFRDYDNKEDILKNELTFSRYGHKEPELVFVKVDMIELREELKRINKLKFNINNRKFGRLL